MVGCHVKQSMKKTEVLLESGGGKKEDKGKNSGQVGEKLPTPK